MRILRLREMSPAVGIWILGPWQLLPSQLSAWWNVLRIKLCPPFTPYLINIMAPGTWLVELDILGPEGFQRYVSVFCSKSCATGVREGLLLFSPVNIESLLVAVSSVPESTVTLSIFIPKRKSLSRDPHLGKNSCEQAGSWMFSQN